ncbi:MAG: 23S rRNA (guanosine(2251)-2'-O)-methyltransferase RlmB [Candidatus Aminicenantaceae bacterium]
MEKASRLNSIIEVIKSSPLRVNKIFIQKDTKKRKIGEIINLANASDIPLLFVPRRTLDHMDRNHQGVVALLSSKEFSSLESILGSSKLPFLVLLDGIEDPQNLGAIIRSAEGAGVDGILIPERRSVGLTRAVSTVSAGALEHVEIARVKNLARTMDDLKKRDVWLVGAEGGRKEYWHEFDYKLPIGLVLGSEGKGLRPLIKKKCDRVLSIPLFGNITSLNVAAAASIFFYEVVRQRTFSLNNPG